ncbi:baseplate assembly protein [Brevundimonas intermedia]|uniref:Baseplate assembly protein n=2 Tax=Brevundimonas intermedia TaxID=74315 RepID=A0ABQ5TB76_9CAUL|nr:baseplate assembly protein [Brevundimonas intermedia]
MPAVIEALSLEELIATGKADFLAAMNEVDPDQAEVLAAVLELESEPLVKMIQVFAYRELVLRQRINDAARAVTIAGAFGADLDNLVALLGVQRLVIVPADPVNQTPAVMETDEALRRRALLAPEAYSVAGPEGAYISHALGASGDVLDASCTSPAPGDVLVTILSRLDDGAPSAELLAAVAAVVSSENVRPLTDHVIVAGADILEFEVVAQVTTFAGPDADVVMASAQSRLSEYLASSYRLGRDITRSGIIAALAAEGVQDVTLISPAANVVCTRLQAARCTGVDVTHAGLGE